MFLGTGGRELCNSSHKLMRGRLGSHSQPVPGLTPRLNVIVALMGLGIPEAEEMKW